MMRGLAEFIMRRRLNAVLATTVASVVWVLFWPIAHLGAAGIGLVSLRLGLKQALLVVVGTSGLILVFGLISSKAMPLAASLLMVLMVTFWLPTLILSTVLRVTASLPLMVKVAAAAYSLLLLAFYLTVGSPYEWWKGVLEPMSGMLQEQTALGQLDMDMTTMVDQVAKLMTGVMAASLLLVAVVNLLIARWWQALLYNTGGFSKEFQSFRLGRGMAMATAVMLLVALLGNVAIASDILFILGACYFLQGMAVLHALSKQVTIHRLWTVSLYILLILIPQMMFLVACLGLFDSWADFRTRFAKKIN